MGVELGCSQLVPLSLKRELSQQRVCMPIHSHIDKQDDAVDMFGEGLDDSRSQRQRCEEEQARNRDGGCCCFDGKSGDLPGPLRGRWGEQRASWPQQ